VPWLSGYVDVLDRQYGVLAGSVVCEPHRECLDPGRADGFQVAIHTRSYSLDRRPGQSSSADPPRDDNEIREKRGENTADGIAAAAMMEPEMTTRQVGQPLAVAERGVAALAPSFVPDDPQKRD